MTEKQKAKHLVDSFEHLVAWDYQYDEAPLFENQRASAIIVVDEILRLNKLHSAPNMLTCYEKRYWEKVKFEIQKL